MTFTGLKLDSTGTAKETAASKGWSLLPNGDRKSKANTNVEMGSLRKAA